MSRSETSVVVEKPQTTTRKITKTSINTTTCRSNEISTARWLLGMAMATTFCCVYFFAPIYIITSILCLLFRYPTMEGSFVIAAPLILSILSKPKKLDCRFLKPMADYFDFETAFEFTDADIREMLKTTDKRFILASQPHGVLSFCGICSLAVCDPDIGQIKTATASVVHQTPILKNVMGIFGLVDASRKSMQRHFQNKGIDGCLVLYVGGIAELFKSSPVEERLFLSQRKGFIKLALKEGVDVIPAYLFGNTSVLSVLKHGPLADLSRKLQVSLTYMWGKYYLPIPRDEKCLYARAKPMGLPHIPDPTDEDVDKWHAKYCEEVKRLFNTYKEKVPAYKHKKLYID
ncbi:Diacylglycerol O-acyltransferase 2 [Seminavis robusta]|uniref:Acyltransferase n=1 Tax=Seminavis robusta TaxID=568900 RepID=A0A9N8DFC9_9STRA|nr:Diacylglycerol O-acyltransferase 2 [Seminavis robusta]|eukprot:Sro66_g037160.1 Diacylglycerol O-acyltransferase 2 (346) ;mRNA; r:59862-61080